MGLVLSNEYLEDCEIQVIDIEIDVLSRFGYNTEVAQIFFIYYAIPNSAQQFRQSVENIFNKLRPIVIFTKAVRNYFFDRFYRFVIHISFV